MALFLRSCVGPSEHHRSALCLSTCRLAFSAALRRADQIPKGMASISRLIGNSDSTGNRLGLQEGVDACWPAGSRGRISSRGRIEPKRRKSHSLRNGSSYPAQATGLPNVWAVVVSTAPYRFFPAGLPLAGRSMANALAGTLLLSWLAFFTPTVYHWHPSTSNPCAILWFD